MEYCERTPFYGLIEEGDNRFEDKVFGFLNKIKLWYGSSTKENINNSVLGIQCGYKVIHKDKEFEPEVHRGLLGGSNIEVKELKLEENDSVIKMSLRFSDNIKYLKFETKNKKILEVGSPSQGLEIKIPFNENCRDYECHIIQSLYGYFDDNGLKSLGFYHISKKNYIFLKCLGLFRLRHLIKTIPEEKEKWSDKSNTDNLDYESKAIIKVCLLPDSTFFSVIRFCF